MASPFHQNQISLLTEKSIQVNSNEIGTTTMYYTKYYLYLEAKFFHMLLLAIFAFILLVLSNKYGDASLYSIRHHTPFDSTEMHHCTQYAIILHLAVW